MIRLSVKIKTNMAIPITTVKKILEELNGPGKNSPWSEVPSTYILSSVSISGPGQINIQQDGLILKVFINLLTGEIKTYLAKWIDIPEAKYLS